LQITSALSDAAPPMAEPLIIATPFAELGELSEHFAQRVDEGRLMLPYPTGVDEGQWVQFQVLYADNSVAMEGTGKVSGAYDNGEEHPAEYRFDIVLEELSFDGTSEVVFERIVVARDSMASADPGTGEVSIAELEAAEAPVEVADEFVGEIPEPIADVASDEAMFEDAEPGALHAAAPEAAALQAAEPADVGYEEAEAPHEPAYAPAHVAAYMASEEPAEEVAEEVYEEAYAYEEAAPLAPARAPAAPRANPGGAQPPPGTLPSPHSFEGGVLTRPALPAAWEPTPAVRPDPAASSGFFDYAPANQGRGGLPKPSAAPRPELPDEARVGHAPAPTA